MKQRHDASHTDAADTAGASKEDLSVHQQALSALAHFWEHNNSTPLTRVVLKLPNSNRRVAMLAWIRRFAGLNWDRTRETLVQSALPEKPNIVGATESPFWMFKVKQVQRRHVSGNTFEPDLFFDRVISDVRANADRISVVKLELAVAELQAIAAGMRARAAHRK